MHPEQLVLFIMMVPDKLTLDLDQLNQMVVDSSGDLLAPLLLKQRKLLIDIHLIHGAISLS
jgi:hypothetical protein